jgi:hypothetical protein
MLDLFPEYKKFINKLVVVEINNKTIVGVLVNMIIKLNKGVKLYNVILLEQDTNYIEAITSVNIEPNIKFLNPLDDPDKLDVDSILDKMNNNTMTNDDYVLLNHYKDELNNSDISKSIDCLLDKMNNGIITDEEKTLLLYYSNKLK